MKKNIEKELTTEQATMIVAGIIIISFLTGVLIGLSDMTAQLSLVLMAVPTLAIYTFITFVVKLEKGEHHEKDEKKY